MSKSKKILLAVSLLLVAGIAAFVILMRWPEKFGTVTKKNAATNYEQGLSYIGRGEYESAQTVFEKLTKTDANNVNYWAQLAVAEYNLKNYAKSIESYEKVLSLDNKNAFAYNGLGNVYRDQSDFTKAEENYRKAIETNDKFTVAYNNLAQMLADQDNTPEAVKVFQQGLLANPDNQELKTALDNLKK